LYKKVTIINKELEKYLKKRHPQQLYNAIRHLPLAGGKRLRPCISLLSCEAVSGDITSALPFAIAIELIHNFTLVHDDIMDKSQLRRNIPTVHIEYGEPTAIIAGDLLFSKAFETMHALDIELPVFKQLDMGLINCIRNICEGQQLDMEFEQRHDVTEQEYIDMISKKTGALFSFASEGGAIIGRGTKKEINFSKNYGKLLGLGFQIWDDYLDISSDEAILGKDIGNDIRNGKKTMIAVHSLNNARGSKKESLEKVFGNRDASDQDIKRVYQIFQDTQSIAHAQKLALKFTKEAKETLRMLQDSEAKQILTALAEYATQRKK
jgi:geranylgeranyl diphosphate synthase type I